MRKTLNSKKSFKRRLDKKNCDFCDSLYQPNKKWQRFCSRLCHDKYWVAEKGLSSDKFKRIEKRVDFIEKKLGIIE